jgi:hypothetical protein
MKHIRTFESFLNENILNEAKKPKVGDELTMIKNGKKGKVVKCDSDMCNVDFGNGDVYGITYRRIKGNKITEEVINEAKKPKSWDTMFAMNAIKDYEDGKFDPDNDASLANWEKDYNGGRPPKPGFETYDIIAYALLTGKKPDGTPIRN